MEVQTIEVSKDIAPTLEEAEKIAKSYAPKAIYTHRETASFFRFRMRPPEDFKQDTFVSITRRNGKVIIILGELK